jgi:carboxyl-terminal processing protease
VTSLAQGGALKLTTSRYRTPSGASIQQKGIAPDILLNASGARDVAKGSGLLADGEVRIALDKLKAQSGQIAPADPLVPVGPAGK